MNHVGDVLAQIETYLAAGIVTLLFQMIRAHFRSLANESKIQRLEEQVERQEEAHQDLLMMLAYLGIKAHKQG